MSITEFLEARVAEDERNAEAWSKKLADDMPIPSSLLGGIVNPARVLAECAAKRAIIKQAEEASSDRYGVINEYCVGDKERAEAYATDPGKLILEALAAVYSDHPDYQQEWAL